MSNRKFNFPGAEKLIRVVKSFSVTEKLIFTVFAVVFVLTTLFMLLQVNSQFLVEIPKFGGTLKEGVVGTPRFINPILALSSTDRDLSSLVYSGLMRIDSEGNLIPDLAESYTISEDGREYIFKIREDAVFHDGEEVMAEDIVFTISKTQDGVIKSPKRANWDGILVEQISEKEVAFVLNQPYSPFLLNTTIGILPKHIWGNVSSEEFAFNGFNNEPIGSGPYKIKSIDRNSSGIALSYTLESFKDFTLGEPYIEEIVVSFYKNEDLVISALRRGEVGAVNSISPDNARELEDEKYRVLQIPLPRIFGVFLNQSSAPVLASGTVRKALAEAVNRESIVNDVLKGYGRVSNSPIPPSIVPFETLGNSSVDGNTEKAIATLENAGWELNEDGFRQIENDEGGQILGFSISTGNVPELIRVAEKVVEDWKAVGADVSLKVFDPNDLNQNVIRPRNYDSLLFGEIIGPDLDFYAFWHSSQRNDPGLNIADYANITVDSALEEAREANDETERIENFRVFESEIASDNPAVFLYSPDFIYIIPEKIKGDINSTITTPSDRFINIYRWYIETDTVWKIFN